MYSQMDQGTSVSESTIDGISLRPKNKRKSMHITSKYIPNSRFSRYNNALLGLLPIRFKEDANELSVQNSGLFSFITFHWVLKYLRHSFNKKEEIQIPACHKSDSCKENSLRLDGIFNENVIKQGQNNLTVFWVIWKFVRTRTFFACLLYILASLISMSGLVFFLPLVLKAKNTEIGYLFALIGTELFSSFLYSASNSINLRTAIRLRSACLSSLYRQAMHTSLTFKISSWQLVSFLLSEGQHVQDFVMAIPNLICTPIILIFCMSFAGYYLMLWGYLSVVIIMALFPCFIVVAVLSKNLLYKARFFSDHRVKLLEQFIVNNIYVKFLKLEKSFQNNLADNRVNEVKLMKRVGLYDNICFSLILLQPFLSLTALFIGYAENMNNITLKLTTFATICIILLIHLKQSLDNFWFALNNSIKGLAAFNKFKTIMTYDTIHLKSKKPKDANIAIHIEDANFQWVKQTTLNMNSSRANIIYNSNDSNLIQFPKKKLVVNDILIDINMAIEKGKLIGICGLPGSGRSSLLLAIMGLLLTSKGSRKSLRQFAYVSEDPIIFKSSLKHNIIFGNELDSQRYYRVTMFCELQDFISQLPEHDDTIIDSKMLSLEQKQRIALARAMYENGDIYLLDRPLTALEYVKSARIFENTLKKSLQDKTILIVTDAIQYLDQCDEVYMLKKGKIICQGTHEWLLKNEQEYNIFIDYLKKQSHVCKDKSNMFAIREDISTTDEFTSLSDSINLPFLNSMNSINSIDDLTDNNLIKLKDSHDDNSALKSVLHLYFSQCGNIISMGFLFLAQILNATLISFLPLILILSLVSISEKNMYLAIFLGLFLWMLFFGIITNYFLNRNMFSTSVRFHDEILKKLFKASISFFQSKSLGILSTINLQLQLTDNDIPNLLHNICLNFMITVMTSCVLFFTSPWYTFAVLFVLIIIILLTRFVRISLLRYNNFGMQYTDVLYTQIITMLTARPLIQAYKKIDNFSKSLNETYDKFMTHLYLIHAAKFWFNFVVHCCSVLLITIIGIMLILLEPHCNLSEKSLFFKINDKEIEDLSCKSLTIVCILQVCYVLQKTVSLYLNTALSFGMLSQVQKFKMSITPECPDDDDSDNEENDDACEVLIRKSYSIKFVNVTLHTDIPVLNSLTFKIRENEKMGFIGLNSSERQAIIGILYKLLNISSGCVQIGKMRISQIPLKNLRSLVSVIPAEPVLFNKSIRNFLSMDIKFPESITLVLQKFCLIDQVNLLPNKLDSIADQCLNSEETQILCLAQAYIQQSPIIIIEDFANGYILEHILTTQMKKLFPQSTILIFANDINGLANCDTIIVMKEGKLEMKGDAKNIITSSSVIPETSF